LQLLQLSFSVLDLCPDIVHSLAQADQLGLRQRPGLMEGHHLGAQRIDRLRFLQPQVLYLLLELVHLAPAVGIGQALPQPTDDPPALVYFADQLFNQIAHRPTPSNNPSTNISLPYESTIERRCSK
jgi:hypothetical protein